MRILILILIFTASLSAQETVYHKGIVIDSLKISDTIDGSYSLYLPTKFDGKKEFPVVFIFDGKGRGLSAARLFQPAAEEQGYILVSSNNVDPEKELKENLAVAALLVQQVSSTLPVDIRSISVAGLAEGAKVATALPLIFNGIHGIIFIGDHFFNFDLLKKSKPTTLVGIVGNQQVDFGEMEMAAFQLKALSIPTQLYVFEGGEEWPDPQLISSAVGNLTLQGMRTGKRPKDQVLVDKLYREDLGRGDQMMSTGNYMMARNFLDDLTTKYDGLVNSKEIKEKLKQLDRSDSFKDQQKEYGQTLEKEQRLMDDFIFYYNEDVEKANFENLGWWNFQKQQLQELTKGANRSEASMGYRLLDMLQKMSEAKTTSFEEERAPLEEKLMAYMLATVFDQQDFAAYREVISLSTLDGDFSTALFYLEEMLKNGYKDLDALYNIEGTLGLKITREYNWLLFLMGGSSYSQTNSGIKQILEFQQELNTSFQDKETSPLTPEDREIFKGINFFPVDTTFRVEAQFVRTPLETPFQMPTTTDRKPYYVKYGEVYFSLKGKEYKLDLFQNLELSADPEYRDYLFAPFTDETNGRSTYGGGRYLDLRIPAAEVMIIDFNKAYNPYCAYNGKYSCPIPPEQNHLEVEITAGVLNYP